MRYILVTVQYIVKSLLFFPTFLISKWFKRKEQEKLNKERKAEEAEITFKHIGYSL